MKKTYLLACLLLLTSLVFTSCGGGGSEDPKLADLIKNATWRLGNVTEGSTNVNSKFQNFTLQIGDGTGQISYVGDVDTGGPGPVNASVRVTPNNDALTITLEGNSGRPFGAVAGNSVTLSNARVDNGTNLLFTVTLNSPKNGSRTYNFNLVK